ncbi:MAG: phosphate signaling complex protein PhoU [SAR202 cluster bacterium]|nr:phosphate transport system regulatory protein PhoU [Chloroflexota bacterium]MQG50997.1 phosphate signaling complex protein PhoU [SAR202 cluster bacterium]
MRSDYSKNLQALQDGLLILGSMVDKAIHKSIQSLKDRNLQLAQTVIDEDDLIDQKRFELENSAVTLLATQSPMAADLRLIISALHIAVELERMGDYAEGIARISQTIGEQPTLKPLIDLPKMTDLATAMLRKSLLAYTSRDMDLAIEVCKSDDAVDSLYEDVYHELVGFMIKDPDTVQRATYLLWVSHDVERIADRATNIAERVIYLITGELSEIDISTY